MKVVITNQVSVFVEYDPEMTRNYFLRPHQSNSAVSFAINSNALSLQGKDEISQIYINDVDFAYVFILIFTKTQ